ncbi:MAG: hypothetical protein LC650_00625 [Actinobacteria bacterium]|nr:hypothetical protein [Actinomycetota bacterium]
MQLGDKLPNGATFIAEAGTVVLAKFREPQPWVTWRIRPGEYQSTGAGHYHTDLREATQDFYERAGISRL